MSLSWAIHAGYGIRVPIADENGVLRTYTLKARVAWGRAQQFSLRRLLGRGSKRMNARRIYKVKNLFDPVLVNEIEQRVSHLSSASRPQWGSMELAQTLAHCTSGIEMAMGVLNVKRAPFPASLIGRFVKPLIFRDDKPMRRNSPSSPELFLKNPTQDGLEEERLRLLEAIRTFASVGPAGCTPNPHPFFGVLEPQQWAILMYKHLDHHLRQFAA